MTDDVEPILSWLRRERRANVVQEILWIQHFDLDGALIAGQPELAWRARGALLVFGVELFLRSPGLDLPALSDQTDVARIVLRRLAVLDKELAEQAWDLLLRHAPDGEEALRQEVAAVIAFLEHRLGVPAAQSRGEAIRAWADGLKLLRDIGKGMGVVGSDSWYLSDDSAEGAQAGWYDEVIKVAASQRHPA